MAIDIRCMRTNEIEEELYAESNPIFRWCIESNQNGCIPQKYSVQVKKDDTVVWTHNEYIDAGTDNENIRGGYEICYDGSPLAELTWYTWTVCVTDNFGRIVERTSSFRTARGNRCWHTNWVYPVQKIAEDERPFPLGGENIPLPRTFEEFTPVQRIRIPIVLERLPIQCFVHISAHGIYRLWINGTELSNTYFAPECTPYDKAIFYQSYDLIDYLHLDKNILAIELADGWWSGRLGLGSWNNEYGNKKELFLECEAVFDDGSIKRYTGEDGKSLASTIRYADLYEGEYYDAAEDEKEWHSEKMDDSNWLKLVPNPQNLDNLQHQIGNGIREIMTFTPQSIIKSPKEEWIVDAGQVLSGFVEFQIDAPKGIEIILDYSESLDNSGNFFQNIMGMNKDQRDVYITCEGKQSWHPYYTYHGFRYVRISGWPGELTVGNFRVIVLGSCDVDAGQFVCSDNRINQLQSNIQWSQRSNMISIPTDCPQREKAGWTGDLMVYMPTLLFNGEAVSFVKRWLYYLRLEQFDSGLVPEVVPYWPVNRKIAEILGSDTSCGWGDAIIFVPWTLYMETGRKEILQENYEAMQKWMSYIERNAAANKTEQWEKYLWEDGYHFGDWLMPSIMIAGGSPQDTSKPTKRFFAAAYYAYSARQMHRIAEVLDKREDADVYSRLYENIRSSFMKKYLDSEGLPVIKYQGAYVICLAFGLNDDSSKRAQIDRLCRLIEDNGDHLDTGFLSVAFLMDVLTDNGREDMAYKLLYQNTCPSWLYMIKMGATSIWESWNGIEEDGTVGKYSFNHYAYGCIGDWIYRKLGGIQNLESGYSKIRLVPGYRWGITMAQTRHLTTQGELLFRWEIDGEMIKLQIKIPIGVSAELINPDGTLTLLKSGSYIGSVSMTAGEPIWQQL